MNKPNLFFPTPVWTLSLDNYKKVISEQTAYQITSFLEGVILRGTGKKLKDLINWVKLRSNSKKMTLSGCIFEKTSTSSELCVRYRKTAARIDASEPNWRIPSSPTVEEKHMVSVCKSEKWS